MLQINWLQVLLQTSACAPSEVLCVILGIEVQQMHQVEAGPIEEDQRNEYAYHALERVIHVQIHG